MMRSAVCSLFLVVPLGLGCPGTTGSAPDGGSSAEDAGPLDAGAPPDPCDALVPAQEGGVPFDTLTGYSGSEDFAFDAEGALVSVDQNGNLTRQPRGEASQLISPGFGDTAGIRILENGDYVLANVELGSLMRITPQGGQSTILSGINYPNGVEVSLDGVVYVAEHDSGRVREVDADTGEFTIIAEDLLNPNGLSFSPDQQTLYVGSFGGGTLHALHRNGTGWDPPVLLAQVSEPGQIASSCRAEGTPCLNDIGLPGICETDANGDLFCGEPPEASLCAAAGDDCTDGFGQDNRCITEIGGTFVCPNVPSEYAESCVGISEGDTCTTTTGEGYCVTSFPEEGGNFIFCYVEQGSVCANKEIGEACVEFSGPGECVDGAAFGSAEPVCLPNAFTDLEACANLAEGDACTQTDGGASGLCSDGSFVGAAGLLCLTEGGGQPRENGGLDGVNVDQCGNVYVTEFTTGKIYRVDPDDGAVETFAVLPSGWIPNMHWGDGIGGFDATTMYVMDRDEGRVFSIETGVKTSPTLFGSTLTPDGEEEAGQ